MGLRRRRSERPAAEPDERNMPFTEHLEELRWHILRSILYVIVLTCFAWYQYDAIYRLVTTPIVHAYEAGGFEAKMLFLDFLEPLLFKLQIAFSAGIVLSLPLVLWEVWRFIRPGLLANEQKFVRPLIPFSILLCLAGLAMVYFALPLAIRFLLEFAPKDGDAELRQNPQRYFFFLIRMMIGSALTFQTPIVLLLLAQLELVTAKGLLKLWRHAVLVCFILAAIITPTVDPINMSVIALPLCALYFLSLILVWMVERKRARLAKREALKNPPVAGGETKALPPPPPDTPPVDPAPTKAAAATAPAPPPPSVPPVVDRSVLGPRALPPPDDEPAEAELCYDEWPDAEWRDAVPETAEDAKPVDESDGTGGEDAPAS